MCRGARYLHAGARDIWRSSRSTWSCVAHVAGACHVRLRLLTSHSYPFLACVHEQLGTHKRAKAKRELCQNLLRAAARKK